jgi:glycerol dehydrogenase-like iron-containing ADH family enzyme
MNKIWNIPEIHLTPLAEVKEPRTVLAVTDPNGWETAQGALRLPVAGKIEPLSASLEHWETLTELSIQIQAEAVYAVGGRLAMDTAKYLAYQLTLPLVCVPTALDSDTFLRASANAQQDGWVKSLPATPAQRVVIDLELIAAAPSGQRAKGLSSVLAMATANWDWKLAEERGKNPPGKAFNQKLSNLSQTILENAIECAQAAGSGKPAGLRQLLDCLCLEVQLCNQAGHNRLAIGSEHYAAYAAQSMFETNCEWQELLGQAILLAAEWQGQGKSQLENALRAANIPLDCLGSEQIERLKAGLPDYCKQHQLDYGIAFDL